MEKSISMIVEFNHIRELHHSQTIKDVETRNKEFNHIRELHHSQTCFKT